ncbi:MAG: polysialyltransferase family glycosyltransferase [Cyclobacteriaceae bacterium]|nr:polysialyltransferase family glycosyltransferase [Cyclobacteriaceae bacterium]
MLNRKILYFDYWIAGIHNFRLFDKDLRNNGFETKLVHLGSWRDSKSQVYQKIEGIECFDIKYYGTSLLFNILKAESPKLVIMLNASSITDRAVVLACKRLGIKLVYLMHGALTREEFIEDSIESTNESLKTNRLLKSFKHLKGTIPNYLYSLFKYDKRFLFRWYPYGLLMKTFINPAKYINFPPPSFDLSPDLSLVYGNIDKRFYGKLFFGVDTHIRIVGNPTLDSYFLQLKDISSDKDFFLTQNSIPLEKPYVTYIEEGLVEDKFWDNEYRLDFLESISKVCTAVGLHLVVKLHPRTAKGSNFNSLLQLKGITLLTDVNFAKLVYFTDKCISHYSTTLIYPMLLDKPILVPRWGKSEFVPTLYKEGEVTFVESIDQLKEYLKMDKIAYDRKKYILDYVPFTDGKTKERIVNHILEIAK